MNEAICLTLCTSHLQRWTNRLTVPERKKNKTESKICEPWLSVSNTQFNWKETQNIFFAVFGEIRLYSPLIKFDLSQSQSGELTSGKPESGSYKSILQYRRSDQFPSERHVWVLYVRLYLFWVWHILRHSLTHNIGRSTYSQGVKV